MPVNWQLGGTKGVYLDDGIFANNTKYCTRWNVDEPQQVYAKSEKPGKKKNHLLYNSIYRNVQKRQIYRRPKADLRLLRAGGGNMEWLQMDTGFLLWWWDNFQSTLWLHNSKNLLKPLNYILWVNFIVSKSYISKAVKTNMQQTPQLFAWRTSLEWRDVWGGWAPGLISIRFP